MNITQMYQDTINIHHLGTTKSLIETMSISYFTKFISERMNFPISIVVLILITLTIAFSKYLLSHLIGDLASQECILGMEFSGRASCGKRVMGLLPAKV